MKRNGLAALQVLAALLAGLPIIASSSYYSMRSPYSYLVLHRLLNLQFLKPTKLGHRSMTRHFSLPPASSPLLALVVIYGL